MENELLNYFPQVSKQLMLLDLLCFTEHFTMIVSLNSPVILQGGGLLPCFTEEKSAV